MELSAACVKTFFVSLTTQNLKRIRFLWLKRNIMFYHRQLCRNICIHDVPPFITSCSPLSGSSPMLRVYDEDSRPLSSSHPCGKGWRQNKSTLSSLFVYNNARLCVRAHQAVCACMCVSVFISAKLLLISALVSSMEVTIYSPVVCHSVCVLQMTCLAG